ncbi:MAG: protein kinase [Planctomycetes bacterium]|nr:protein kinase [Planctomycetota bacterium]
MPESLDFTRLRSVFVAALDLPSGERERFVREASEGAAELRAELLAMLAHHDSPPPLLLVRESPGGSRAHGEAPPDPPHWIGPYRLLDRIGTGGVGVVHRAEQQNPRRVVALKLLQLGAMRADILARFLREAELLARLQHPGIAQIIDAGSIETPLGPQPYFAMEFVDGLPLTRYAEQRGLDVRARCRLLVQLCEAVQHAHDRGVVHRDLKPANVLVCEPSQGLAQVKVLDFGIARTVATEDESATLLTHQGQLVGTLHYMSPEQLVGRPVDVRADVYALGAVAYELLAGRPPLELDGQPLSRVIEIVAQQEPEPLRTLEPSLDRDLEAVVATALEKRPIDRYPSAASFAADLSRHLAGEAVRVRRPGLLERCRRFSRRHRTLVSSIAATISILLLAIVVVALYAARNQRLAESERMASRTERRSRYFAEMNLASAALAESSVARVAELVAEWSPREIGDFDARGWEWRFLERIAATAETVIRARGVQFAVAWLPDGRLAAHDEGGCTIWDPSDSEADFAIEGRSDDFVAVEFAPDGRSVAVRWNDTVHIHDLESGALRASLPCRGGAAHFAWHSDSARLAIADTKGTGLWDVAEARETRRWKERFDRMAFCAGNRLVASLAGDGIDVTVLDAPAAPLHLQDSAGQVLDIAVAPRGDLVAAAMVDGSARVWDLATGQLLARIAHEDQVLAVAWSPDGERLASAGRDHNIRLWQRGTREVESLLGHGNAVLGLAFRRDGERLASASEDGTIRIWPPRADRADASLALGVRAGSDERPGWISFAAAEALSVVLPARSGSHRVDGSGVMSATDRDMEHWNEDGTRFAHAEPQAIVLCDARGTVLQRAELAPKDGSPSVSNGGLVLDRRGRSVAFSRRGEEATVWIWSPEDGIAPTRLYSGWSTAFAWSPDGESLAVCGDRVAILARRDGSLRTAIPIVRSVALAWHPRGDSLAVADHGMRIHLCSLATASATRVLRGHTRTVRSLAWQPNGERLASAGNDHRVRLWEPDDGNEVLTLHHAADVFAVAWHRDGETLVSASEDGVVRTWSAKPAPRK